MERGFFEQNPREVRVKLYFAPGACSLSPHIILREAGHKFELEQVNNAVTQMDKVTQSNASGAEEGAAEGEGAPTGEAGPSGDSEGDTEG